MDFPAQLAAALKGTVVVMGMGNPCRGDDGAGSRVAQRIFTGGGVHVIDAQEVPENFLHQIVRHRPDTILLIDAVEMGSPPGSVALLGKNETTGFWPSTHRVPMSLVVKYLEQETQAQIFLVAIQPSQTDFMQPMSAGVAGIIDGLADVLNEVLANREDVSGLYSQAA